jgi:hypothetical protein
MQGLTSKEIQTCSYHQVPPTETKVCQSFLNISFFVFLHKKTKIFLDDIEY